MFNPYSRVRLVTEEIRGCRRPQGHVWIHIIEVYGDGHYEVEFSDPSAGITLAQLVVAEEDAVHAPEGTPGSICFKP